MVAILGRGIQRLKESDPNDEVLSYVLTEDLELCDKDSAHLPVRVPADDASPYCMVGGGEMNLGAGIELLHRFHPRITVCACGTFRSQASSSGRGTADCRRKRTPARSF